MKSGTSQQLNLPSTSASDLADANAPTSEIDPVFILRNNPDFTSEELSNPVIYYKKYACWCLNENWNAIDVASYFQKAAEVCKEPLWQFYLGLIHAAGFGVSQSKEEALKWLKKAADQNFDLAKGVIETFETHELAEIINILKKWCLNNANDTEDFKLFSKLLDKIVPTTPAKTSEPVSIPDTKADEKSTDKSSSFNPLAKVATLFSTVTNFFVPTTPEKVSKAAPVANSQANTNNTDEKAAKSLSYTPPKTINIPEYEKLAEQGDLNAQFQLGRLYFRKGGAKKEIGIKWLRKAIPEYQKLAEKGDFDAQFHLALCYFEGYGIKKDTARAIQLFQKAAEGGHAYAQFHLGALYLKGHDALAANEKQGIYWLQKAAQEGNHAKAQNLLGTRHFSGKGMQKNWQTAVAWFQKAADQGFVHGQYNLGNCYFRGQGVDRINLKKAVKYYQLAAEQGDADAQNSLGRCYFDGSGVAKDVTKAVNWLKKAADQGNMDALLFLDFHHMGKEQIVVSSAGKEAVTPAAESHHKKKRRKPRKADNSKTPVQDQKPDPKETTTSERSPALSVKTDSSANIADPLPEPQVPNKQEDKASPPSTEAADKLNFTNYQKLAEQGDAEAQCKLASCFEEGKEVEKNIKMAIQWYKRAADQGNAEASYRLGVILLNDVLEIIKKPSQSIAFCQRNLTQAVEQPLAHLTTQIVSPIFGPRVTSVEVPAPQTSVVSNLLEPPSTRPSG